MPMPEEGVGNRSETAGLLSQSMPSNMRHRLPRADVVIVFPCKTSPMVKFGADEEFDQTLDSRSMRPAMEAERSIMETWATKRKGILARLADTGLIIVPYYSADRACIFVKVAMYDKHLGEVAEMIGHKLQLKEEYLSAYAPYKVDFIGQRELNYADRTVVSHLFESHTKDDDKAYPRPEAIFLETDRIRVIDYIIRESGHNCAGLDLGTLMHEGDVLHYYPMHENKELMALDNDWSLAFLAAVHIKKVRDYFGERIGLYFLFMSHLNTYLIPPAVIGFVLMIVNPVVYGTPDNWTALALCPLVGVWTTLFVHFWRRKCAAAALDWGTLEMSRSMEPSRSQFYGESRINPVTERIDRYYPMSSRIWLIATSWVVVTLSVAMLCFVVAWLFYLRRVYHKGGGRIIFQIINAVVVCISNDLFTMVAKFWTDKENHRTDSEYSYHLLAKTVVFKFINSYISLYYIAFVKRHDHIFGERMKCVDDDCMNDLGSQLGIFMGTRLFLNYVIELGVPILLEQYRKIKEGRSFHTSFFSNPKTIMPNLSSAEKQCFKAEYDTFEDFDEVLIVYGYTTLFVVACPWVPLLALLGNFVEVLLDQKKLILLYRRPFPTPARDNEPWDTAFDIVGGIAMFTNLAVVVFASHEFDDLHHHYKLLIFIAAEHFLIMVRVMAEFFLPATPTEVKITMLRQRALVHKHFNLGGEDEDEDMRASAMRTYAGAPIPVEDHDLEEDDDEGYC